MIYREIINEEDQDFDAILRNEGRIAYELGKEIEDCPYRRMSEEHRLWCQGFKNAHFGSVWADKEMTWQ